MLRRLSTTVLAASLVFATTPSFACTGISLNPADGVAIRGRTLEFGFPMNSAVLVIPAGQELSGTLPDGSKGMTYTTRYAAIGANALDQTAFLYGLNDKGLSIGLFYFPNYAKYTDVTKENASRALAPADFGTWVLGSFATVDEVKAAVKDVVIAPTPMPGLGSAQVIVPGVHFFIKDQSGKAIVVEPFEGTLKVHHAPLGVMTNAPTYDWHMTNLRNYINLSVKDVESEKLGDVTLPAFGSGMPGDFTPPSRFVRAAIFSQNAAPRKAAEEAVLSAFHILNQFDIPKGAVVNGAIGEPIDEITEWTSVADLKNLRWYFRTFDDQSIRVVDLKQAVEAANGKISTIPMEATKQPVANVSKSLQSRKQAAN